MTVIYSNGVIAGGGLIAAAVTELFCDDYGLVTELSPTETDDYGLVTETSPTFTDDYTLITEAPVCP